MSAILFLYREVLAIELPWLNGINRPTQKQSIPSVLTKGEVAGLLAQMDGEAALIARLLYGTGMRLREGMRHRIKDVDFERQVIIVRDAKGGKDRVVMLPRLLVAALRLQLLAARALWEADRQAQRGGVETPHVLKVATGGTASPLDFLAHGHRVTASSFAEKGQPRVDCCRSTRSPRKTTPSLKRSDRTAVGGACSEQHRSNVQPPKPANTFCTSSLSSMAARKVSTSSSASALRLAGSTGFLGW